MIGLQAMHVLLIGGGGREHALAWAISASPLLTRLYCAPGNAGIAECAECIELDAADHEAVIGSCRENGIGLVVIGPEAPLVAGLADDLRAAGFKVVGPGREGAQLEGSKRFTKELCAAHGIPTAAFAQFGDREAALAHISEAAMPIVIKADGLAAGKGVIIAETRDEAEQAVNDCFGGAFGEAGASIVIEAFLEGEEASFFALCDGVHVLPLASAQDHKRAFDGDKGPNTGGMGAYSPAPIMTPELHARVMHDIILPTVAALRERGIIYKGVLYAGLMIGADGPKLIEYNARFGDPDCQVLMPRLKSDILPALLATAEGTLDHFDLRWRDETALTVVMASKGYPGAYEKGSEIACLDEAGRVPGVTVFHAGTRRDGERILANGGRVLNVTALGASVSEARDLAYRAIARIDWAQGFYRRDIGWRAIEREQHEARSA
jgi:phosphoribosylamine--glycine ligase